MINDDKRCNDLTGKEWLQNSFSIWRDLTKTKEEKDLKHPASYPVMLCEKLIKTFSKGGDNVLDPFNGIGSTLVASHNLNRSAVGIDLSKEFCDIAKKRIGQDDHITIINGDSFIEKRIHSIIDRVDDSLHAREQLENGRIREREFFKISPETAYGIFKDIAAIKGNPESLKLYTPTLQQTQEQELAESKTKRSNNSFKLLNIVVGERIRFLYDDSIIAKVFDDKNQVEFEGVQYSVTGLAKKILVEKFGWSKDLSVNGWRFFMHNSIVLNDLRDEIEGARSED